MDKPSCTKAARRAGDAPGPRMRGILSDRKEGCPRQYNSETPTKGTPEDHPQTNQTHLAWEVSRHCTSLLYIFQRDSSFNEPRFWSLLRCRRASPAASGPRTWNGPAFPVIHNTCRFFHSIGTSGVFLGVSLDHPSEKWVMLLPLPYLLMLSRPTAV